MGQNGVTINIINILRPTMLLLVIFNHCTHGLQEIYGGGKSLMLQWIEIGMGMAVTPAAVDTFFLISGFLFFFNVEKVTKETFRYKIRKRFQSLMIPYIIWNILGCLMVIFIKSFKNSSLWFLSDIKWWCAQFWCVNVWREDNINIFGWATPMYGPVDLPLWYLRDLIVVSVLLSPILYYCINKWSNGFLIMMLLLFIFKIWPYKIPGFSIDAILFWSVGAYLALKRKNMYIKIGTPFFVIIALLFVVVINVTIYLLRFDLYNNMTYITQQFLTLLSVFFFLLCGSKCATIKSKIPSIIIVSSFFVYAFHDFTGKHLIRICDLTRFHYDMSVMNIIAYILTPLIVYMVSIMFYMLLRRIAPNILSLLNGGRT